MTIDRQAAEKELLESLARANERMRQRRFNRRGEYLETIVTYMAIFGAIILCLLILIFGVTTVARGATTFGWPYQKFHHETITGYRLYKGSSPDAVNTLVADIPKSSVTVVHQQPYLLVETFDTDPGSKYPLTQGAWTWVAAQKSMKVDSTDFMVVFEKPAGVSSAISFWFWPEKALGDQPQLLNYNKDEAQGAYYELRFGSSSGTRYSNFRKVYDQQFGGVDPAGAFPLQRYPQCNIVEGQNNVCQGYRIFIDWDEESYTASILNQATGQEETVAGGDTRALDVNKLEILAKQQSFWIDDIRIGGRMELKATVDVTLPPPGGKTYFALSAYRIADGTTYESSKSIPLSYMTPNASAPGKPKGLRHKES